MKESCGDEDCIPGSVSEVESEVFEYDVNAIIKLPVGKQTDIGKRKRPQRTKKVRKIHSDDETDDEEDHSEGKRKRPQRTKKVRRIYSDDETGDEHSEVKRKRPQRTKKVRKIYSDDETDDEEHHSEGKRKRPQRTKKVRKIHSDDETDDEHSEGDCASEEGERKETVPGFNILNTKISSVIIGRAHTSKNNKRIYDKRQACLFCSKLVAKIPRHFANKHGNESEVADALSHTKGSPERKKKLEKLRLLGNFHHNMNVLETGSGQLIVVRRPSDDCKMDDFLPCSFCLGFMRREDLWKHSMNCQFKPDGTEEIKYQRVQAKAKMLILPSLCSGSNKLLFEVVASMRSDEITLVARTDPLIVSLGTILVNKHGKKGFVVVSQKLREVSRLLIQLRKTDHSSNNQLADFIKPEKFDVVLEAVKDLCNFQIKEGESEVGIPSLALKVGHSLKKCAQILQGRALRNRDKILLEDAQSFEKLMESEWSDRISHHSLNTLGNRKYNKVEVLPLAEDLFKLKKYILSKIDEYTKSLQSQPSLDVWRGLASAALARLVLFNKRRGGEASRMHVQSYLNKPDWTKVNSSEIMASLTNFEKELCKRLDMVEIRGKRGRKVPVVLTPELKQSIMVLLQTRAKVGIPKENPFVFARASTESKEHMRAWDCLHQLTKECQPPLLNPASVTSTKLRKYISTISQVLDLGETEVDWLARHLGHDIRVHRDYYRLHESTIEIAKVSKLLLTTDQGNLSKFAGKKLSEINIGDIPEPEFDKEDMEDNDEHASDGDKTDNESNSFEKESDPVEHRNSATNKKGQNPQTRQTSSAIGGRQKAKRAFATHKLWSREEKESVFKTFGEIIRRGDRLPGKTQCEMCKMKANGILDNRDWTAIKYFVKNQIDKRKKHGNSY